MFYGVVSVFEQVKGRVRQRNAKKIKRRVPFVFGPPLLVFFLPRRGHVRLISRVKILFRIFPEPHPRTGARPSPAERRYSRRVRARGMPTAASLDGSGVASSRGLQTERKPLES